MIRVILLAAVTGLSTTTAYSAPDPSAICDAVSETAAREAGLPTAMLRALTRTETGRARSGRLEPWPWTINMEGAGHWFDNRDDALAFAQKHHARGATSFDVGCFQINYRWHHQAFPSVEAMFDPLENARYAARYLLELKSETDDWRKAVGHYHSRTPARAEKYVTRYARIKDRLQPPVETDLQLTRPPAKPVAFVPAPAPVSPGIITAPAPPGGVSLVGFSQTTGLLTAARPLFD